MRNLIKKLVNPLKPYFRRFNQMILCMPIWLITGVSGRFKERPIRGEWVETNTDADNDQEKMY